MRKTAKQILIDLLPGLGIGPGYQVVKSADSLLLLKAKDRHFLFGLPSNNAWDGWSVITERAHHRYINFLNEHPNAAPFLNIWHVPGSQFGKKADWWDFTTGGFLALLWEIEKGDMPVVDFIRNTFSPGMSVEGIAMYSNWGEISHYWLNFVAVLAQSAAQNKWANFVIFEERSMALSDEGRSSLAEKFDETVVAAIEEQVARSEEDMERDAPLRMDAPTEDKTSDEDSTGEDKPENENSSEEIQEEPQTEVVYTTPDEVASALATFGVELTRQISEELTRQLTEQLEKQLQAGLAKVEERLAKMQEQEESRPNIAALAMQNMTPFDRTDGDDSAKIDGRSALAKSSPEITEAVDKGYGGIGLHSLGKKADKAEEEE